MVRRATSPRRVPGPVLRLKALDADDDRPSLCAGKGVGIDPSAHHLGVESESAQPFAYPERPVPVVVVNLGSVDSGRIAQDTHNEHFSSHGWFPLLRYQRLPIPNLDRKVRNQLVTAASGVQTPQQAETLKRLCLVFASMG